MRKVEYSRRQSEEREGVMWCLRSQQQIASKSERVDKQRTSRLVFTQQQLSAYLENCAHAAPIFTRVHRSKSLLYLYS